MQFHVVLFSHLEDDLGCAVLGVEVVLAVLQLYLDFELVALDVVHPVEEDLFQRVLRAVGGGR